MDALADEFYRLSHDDSTGKPRLHPRTVGLGLAAALLGELVESRHVSCWDGELRVVDRSPSEDPVARMILDQMLASPEHVQLRVWLDFLSRSAAQVVAERMYRAGQMFPQAVRRGLIRRRALRYIPTNINRAAWPSARIYTKLQFGRPLSEPDIFLTGLVFATGLDSLLLDGAPDEAIAYARQLMTGLDLPRQELLAATEAAVGDAVLSYRG